jgi:hypothetical protein
MVKLRRRLIEALGWQARKVCDKRLRKCSLTQLLKKTPLLEGLQGKNAERKRQTCCLSFGFGGA